MKPVTVHAAKTHLSKLIERACAGEDVVIAREIKKGDQVLTLRDAKGFPLWSGQGRTH